MNIWEQIREAFEGTPQEGKFYWVSMRRIKTPGGHPAQDPAELVIAQWDGTEWQRCGSDWGYGGDEWEVKILEEVQPPRNRP